MSWPAPTDLSTLSPTLSSPVESESDSERRRISAVPAATWVALLGGAMVITASVVVLTTSWDALGRGVRLAVLTAGAAAVVWASERLRGFVPTTAGIVAHVGTFLIVPFGIAAVSLFGATWPYCMVAGGVAGALFTEFQSKRWRAGTMQLGQLVAIAVGATGLAAITSTSGGLIAACTALAFALFGEYRRAMLLVSLALLSPLLSAMADSGIGVGSLARAGLYGDRLVWSAPVVGLISAAVFGLAATRIRRRQLWSLAVSTPVFGAITGVLAADGMTTLEATIPGVLLITAEVAVTFFPERQRSIAEVVVDVVAALASFIVLASVVALNKLGVDWPSVAVVGSLAVSIAFVSVRRHAKHDPVSALLIAGALCGSLGAAALAADLGTNGWAAAIFMAVCFTTAFLGRRWKWIEIQLCGLATGAVATITWIVHIRMVPWLLDLLAPYGFTADDLTTALLSASLLLGGGLLRRWHDLHSALAYGIGLLTCSIWLIDAQVVGQDVWTLPTALTVGIVATALGAWHRLAAPLVIGTALTVVAVILSSVTALGALPNWVWLAVGGLALLVIAALIERGGVPGKTELRLLVARWG